MQNKSKKSAVRSLAVMVLFLLIAIRLVVELLRIYVPNVWAAFSSGDENALQTCFDGQSTAYSAGLLWLLSFVQILSVVLPAMPVQLVAGIVLGPWLGCAVCLTACMAAHTAVFYAATHAQTSLAALEEASPKLKKARDALSVKRNRTYYTTILLLAPGLPNGIIPYAAAAALFSGAAAGPARAHLRHLPCRRSAAVRSLVGRHCHAGRALHSCWRALPPTGFPAGQDSEPAA